MAGKRRRKWYQAKALGENRHSSGTRDLVMAGKRRRKLARLFIELSSMIPSLEKTDKASVVLDHTINNVKQLQERVNRLEEQTKKNSVEGTRAFAGEGTSSMEKLPEIDVRVQEKNVLINIHCENKEGLLSKILCEIRKLHLKIVNFSALHFADCFLDTTVHAQMGDTFCMTTKDLKRDLRLALLKVVS